MPKTPATGVVLPLRRTAPATTDAVVARGPAERADAQGDRTTDETTDETADERIVRQARSGDAVAKTELYRRQARRLTALAVRLLGSRADADDAVQEAFVLAFCRLHQLRDDAAVGGWLTQLLVSQAHRILRRRRLRNLFGLHASTGEGLPAWIPAPAVPPDVRSELALLSDAMANLRPHERLAWTLRNVEGFELAEVARLCECSLATVKRRISAAHRRVERHLGVLVQDLPGASDVEGEE